MDQQTIISAYEGRAKALGIPIYGICRKAGIHPTTFSRWKLSERNPLPTGATVKSLAALDKVLTYLENQSARAA